jgi:hypothetical protein
MCGPVCLTGCADTRFQSFITSRPQSKCSDCRDPWHSVGIIVVTLEGAGGCNPVSEYNERKMCARFPDTFLNDFSCLACIGVLLFQAEVYYFIDNCTAGRTAMLHCEINDFPSISLNVIYIEKYFK